MHRRTKMSLTRNSPRYCWAVVSQQTAESEKHIAMTAAYCHKLQQTEEKSFLTMHTKDLIERRWHLKDRDDDLSEISKLIQKSIKQDIRERNTAAINNILEKFKGL